jgi:type I restriction enzyme R subunit
VTVTTVNFAFLANHGEVMVKTAALAERNLSIDPPGALAKLRRLGELLAESAAVSVGIERRARTTQAMLLDQLANEGMLSPELLQLFTDLRKAGNAAVHEDTGTQHEALHHLQMARKLAVWFHQSFGDPAFVPDTFVTPPEPADVEAMREQLLALQAQTDALREAHEARLAQLLAQSQTQAPAQLDARVQAARRAAAGLELSEAETRELIDIQLREAGWEVDSKTLRHGKGTRPTKGRNLAIAEWPTRSGPADYVLFRGLTPLAIVEAKRDAKDVRGCLEQAKRYSKDFIFDGDELAPAGGPWAQYKVPFLFATNGRPFLRQLIEASGIWFLDARVASNHRRALDGWKSPDGLADLLAQDIGRADAKLSAEALDDLPLREYQRKAIRAVEAGIAEGRRQLLLAMATGTGKTRTCICLIYRLIKAGRFKRVLFLVDRRSLGDQAQQAFEELKLEQQQTFDDIYDLKQLGDQGPERDTRLQIATIQAMVRRLDSDKLSTPVDQYDCIIIDECHRGYTLDRELDDAELEYRSPTDYISKYRRVLDHFDAVKIGLTATPALHTTEIFGEPIYTYSYQKAVIEGHLIDHEPPVRIITALSQTGVNWAAGEQVNVYRVRERTVDLIHTPDEIQIDIDGFNRQAIVPAFNRAVCGQLAKDIDPSLPGKTLIFCANDRHADDVVGFMLEAFAETYGPTDNDAVVKITGASDKVDELIKRFKNERNPRVAVTVDLLTTGIDVPQIVNLVFLRRVRSRILYDQMVGRATRLCDDIGKRYFRIFDPVDLYAALQDYTDMLPVVSDVQTSFRSLLEGLTHSSDDAHRRTLCTQLIAKVQRKRRSSTHAQLDHFVSLAGETPIVLLRQMAEWSPSEMLAWWQARPALVSWLDQLQTGRGPAIPISDEIDEVIDVSYGYGDAARPEDYLEGFSAFLRDNLNKLPALLVVTQRPRDLTRAQLRDLQLALAQAGYTEARLEAAWRQTTNQDIAASIIGFIRGQALGSPLLPYEQRVQAALARLLAGRAWSQPQRDWLRRIGKQLLKQRVIDRAMLDEDEAFKASGGFVRIDKQFGGELEQLLCELNAAVWQDAV